MIKKKNISQKEKDFTLTNEVIKYQRKEFLIQVSVRK